MLLRPPCANRYATKALLFAALAVVVPLSANCLLTNNEVTRGPAVISVCESTIDVHVNGETGLVSRADLFNWIRRAGTAVCTFYGKFPLSHVNLDVRVHDGAGVSDGVTRSDHGGHISITVGKRTSQKQLDEDWELTHEMIHLAFPSVPERHHWIEEGIAVYVEPIARVKAGQLAVEQMWRDVVRDMPQGEPEAGDKGLDHTPTWGRTYWGGAMFCLLADVRIRRQTHNKKGLQDALRGILSAGGTVTVDWPLEQALAAGDKATSTTVLVDLYHEMRDQPVQVDLPDLWKQLGIVPAPDGSIRFDSTAPLANVRAAITQREDVSSTSTSARQNR